MERAVILLPCLIVLLSAGCGEEESIRRYRVDKEPGGSSPAGPQYSVPEGWEETEPGPMRAASFRIADDGQEAEVSLMVMVRFPRGRAGGYFNSLRAGLGLEKLEDAELENSLGTIGAGSAEHPYFDGQGQASAGGGPSRILAVLAHLEDRTLIFKMTGPAGLVEREKAAFETFVRSAVPADRESGPRRPERAEGRP